MTFPSSVPDPANLAMDDDEEALDPRAGLDPATGRPLLLRSKCATCIYRPGNHMHLRPGRREEMADLAVARWSWITCHSTLPGQPGAPAWHAICRGFYDARGRDSIGIRLAWLYGGPVEVDLPSPTHEDTT